MKRLQIVVAKDLKFFPKHYKRLDSLGAVTYYKQPAKDPVEWYERCENANIICTGQYHGFYEKVYELKDVFISLPLVTIDPLDPKILRERNITISNSPGGNTEAVVEWIIGMILMNFRSLHTLTRTKSKNNLTTGKSLVGKNITILGKGYIGRYLGTICASFGMKIQFFQRGDNLKKSIEKANIVVNCLSVNSSTENLLDRDFFLSLKKGSFFVSVTRPAIYDIEALKEALDRRILIGTADDAGGAKVGDVTEDHYKQLLNHPKISVTPHIAWNSESERKKSNDIMIDNVKAWINKKPIHVVYG